VDCSEIRDIIDAYALSAGSPDEAAQVESHVAECVRCWDDLGKAQRTAALLALSAPMMDVPEALGDRIMAIARQEAADSERPERPQPLLQRVRLSWASAAAGLGVAGVAALAFAGVLQAQVNDLKTENNRIESQMRGANQELEIQVRSMTGEIKSQEALLTTLIVASHEGVELKPDGQAQASVWYRWNSNGPDGWVMCERLADAPDGMVYQVWFKEGTVSSPVVAFMPEDGDCRIPVDLTALTMTPTGIGLSLEESGATSEGPAHWLDYANFPITN